MIEIEICIDCDDSHQLACNLVNAFQSGAQRIELCSAMAEQGLTPDSSAIRLARHTFASRAGVLVMIRPRAGDFYYNVAEIALMAAQIKAAANAGADGVVFAVLSKDQAGKAHFNLDAMAQLLELARSLELQVSCHRAFDALENIELGLQQLLTLGFDRVLTGGCAWDKPTQAVDNISEFNKLIQLAKGQIEIVIAGGLTLLMAQKIVAQLKNVNGKISFHAFSGVLVKTRVSPDKVAALVNLSLS